MAEFIIIEKRPAVAIWTYKVEAESQSEAYAKVFDEYNVMPESLNYDVDFEGEMEVEIKDVK